MPTIKERERIIPANTITRDELRRLRGRIPASWKQAAGLMRHKRASLLRHIATVHKEWDR